ncbi:MAG: response regulator [Thermodesulfobacteriota bacterium]
MNTEASKPEIPEALIAEWQWFADMLAKVCTVPVALVKRCKSAELERVASSRGDANPYPPGSTESLESGGFCATVVATGERLLVPNAQDSPDTADNPDTRMGMTFYLGYPLLWPDHTVFGTICVLDRNPNTCPDEIDRAVRHFRDLVETSLGRLTSNELVEHTETALGKTFEDLTKALVAKATELEAQVSERTDELTSLCRRLEAELSRRGVTKQVLPEGEESFGRLTEHIPEVFWQTEIGNPERVLYVSPAYETIWGRTAEELYSDGRAWARAVHPDDTERVNAALAAFQRGETQFDVEYRIIRPDGSERWVWDRGFHVHHTEGSPRRVAGIALDITARKAAEEKTRVIVDNLLDGLITIDEDGTIQTFNPAASRMFGYRSDEMAGRNVRLLIGEPHGLRHDQYLRDYLQTGSCRLLSSSRQIIGAGREAVALRSDGSEFPIELHVSEVKMGSSRYFIGVIRDITARALREQALIDARKAAEEAGKFKSEFVANMSHEIRTPLNAILGLTELALRNDLSPRLENHFTKIRAASRSLLGIVNDILDFSKIEAGRIEIESVPLNLEVLLTDLADMFAPVSAEKGVEFCLSLAPDVPLNLVGDPLRLGQVLTNLTGNAFKFTESGEVVVSVKGAPTTSDRVRLEFSVSDTGIGIPQEKLSKVFDSFSQADTSTTRRYGGSGLGLTISRQLVHMMGGSIRVESAEGKGSTFLFVVELGLQSQPSAGRRLIPDVVQGLKVLLVDDSETSRQIMGRSLRTFGLRTTLTCSGREAIEQLVAAARTDPFSLVFIDRNMPEIDGLEATVMIRRDRRLALCQPRIIVLSEFGREEQLQKAVKAGADAFLVKPVNPSVMFDAIMDVYGLSPRSGRHLTEIRGSQNRPLESLRGAKVLVAEDNRINQQVAVRVLRTLGVLPTVVGDGRAAVEAVSRETFDAVLMDIQMPVMDGYEAVRIIRTDPKNRELPIIAMTAHAMKRDREKSLAAGMNDHMTKPIDIDELSSTLVSWVAPRTPFLHPEAEDKCPSPVEKEPEIPAELPGINVKAAMARLGGNKRLLKRLLAEFVRVYSQAHTTLREALAADDIDTAKRLVHTLKGVSGNISADRLYSVMSLLDSELKSGVSPMVEPLLGEFDKELSTVLQSAAGVQDKTETAVVCDEVPVDRSALKSRVVELARLLQVQNMKAEDCFEEIRGALSCSGLAPETEKLGKKINELDYAGALGILSQMAVTLGIRLKGAVP